MRRCKSNKRFKKFYQEDNAKIQNSLDFGHDSP